MRVTLSVTQMHRGQLHARSCRHDQFVGGPYRPSGRNAYPSGITPPTIMSPTQTPSGPSTEIRLSARAHPTTIADRAHAPPPPSARQPTTTRAHSGWLQHTSCTDKERGSAPTERCPPNGPLPAAIIIGHTAGAQRFPTDGHFARHAGTAPVPASSGNTQRHRLHRGGNRQLNRAIHIIALSRARTDPATRAYLARKHAEGKTKREAIRCLKRHLARRIWRLLNTTQTPAAPPVQINRSNPQIPTFT